MQDCYSVTSYTVQSILGQITSKEIAIPEIQRPFVWSSSKVRDLIDSLYKGYPTGYLITWRNPDVKIKGGGTSEGKTVLIDGQQRVTAITAALAGQTVLNEDYEQKRIKISFNPLQDEEDSLFEVCSPIFEKDKRWISDISIMFQPGFSSFGLIQDYIEQNHACDTSLVETRITNLLNIAQRQLGVIIINANCNIDEVTDIFIRINSKGVVLSQADFAMSKIAADESHGGGMLRKAIDYFCHLAVKPEFWNVISTQDKKYIETEYARKSEWLKNDYDDIYDPDYGDMLRVAFMYKFGRAKLADLVALLSGRDFESRDFKSEIADESFVMLKEGVLKFISEGNFKDFVLAIRSAGFISSNLISTTGALNFAYNLYLSLRDDKAIIATDVKRCVQRWFVMSLLTGRYSASPESAMDRDIRRIKEVGFYEYLHEIVEANLSDAFWNASLPQKLNTTSTQSPAWLVYIAAQVKDANNTLFTNSVKVSDVIASIGDIHHIFPKDYLKREIGATKQIYNQVANYTYLEKRININIGAKSPGEYFSQAFDAVEKDMNYFGNIGDSDQLIENLKGNCIPLEIVSMNAGDYDVFLSQRRKLMAIKIKNYFMSL